MKTKNEVFRIPFAYGRITRIDKLTPSAVVYLQDDSTGVVCTISNSCTKKYSDYIVVGTVIVFQSVSFFFYLKFYKCKQHARNRYFLTY